LVLAADLVKAAKAGEQKDVVDIKRRWYENADEIVKFLSTINPYIPANKFKKLFYDHLRTYYIGSTINIAQRL
jgi:hypothetical protein